MKICLKGELYKVYEKSNRHLLPKETGGKTCDDLKRAYQQKQVIDRQESEDDLLRALSVPPNVSAPLSDEQLPACLPPPLSPLLLGLRHSV